MLRRMHVAHGMEGYKQVHGYCVDVLENVWLHMECSYDIDVHGYVMSMSRMWHQIVWLGESMVSHGMYGYECSLIYHVCVNDLFLKKCKIRGGYVVTQG